MSTMLRFIIFIGASTGILYVSWESLHNPRSHGFYRLFAWEAIVALILLNFEYWFNDPFSVQQIVSWLLLILSLFLVVHGIKLLHIAGRPDNKRNDMTLIGVEKTTKLVTVGAFKYIRHPLYSSLLFLAWGVFFKAPSWAGGGLTMTATLFLLITAKVEEIENKHFFGSAYQAYMKQTKMFIPFIW
jgi:protein-S-isoprenylcysteine O-methyltransferase Ste14